MTTAAADEKPRRRARSTEDLELKRYRELMPPPDHWEDGFGLKAMIGALFVGIIMAPASMYMGLFLGTDIGSAAQWVTVILFMEVARRAFTVLKRPEIYVLFYMAGSSLVGTGLLGNQFLPQSVNMRSMGITPYIPSWVAPSNLDVLGQRNFFMHQWLVPIGLMALGMFLSRVDHFGLGYVMYRITSDVEKLPFPMAPVGAEGITALADASGGKESWRWRVFSFGAVLGMAFGIVFVALPAITGAFLNQPLEIFPIPFKDLTSNAEDFLPAVPLILSFNLGLFISGMVLPFWAMVGGFIGMVCIVIANPILYHYGLLHTWAKGIGALQTINANTFDFYLSFGFGLTAAIALVGFWHMSKGLLSKRDPDDDSGVDWRKLFHPPAGRGDISIWIGVGIYVFSTVSTIVLAIVLLTVAHRENPLNSSVGLGMILILIFYGFIYTPLLSYVSARMEGIVGMTVAIPYVREATFILGGYKGAAIWFAPFPAIDYGGQTVYFRTTELTGTKITSMIKAEAFIFPIVLVSTILFSQFIWSIAPVPSSAFPYANVFWEQNAYKQALVMSSTLPGGAHGPFREAFHAPIIFGGLGIALAIYCTLSWFGLPVFLFYGIMRGMDGTATADYILPQFIGALLGRYYFERKFGEEWKRYIIVFFAGYSCGIGLVTMLSLGLVFMSKSVVQSAF
jgi:hypothetical protein